MATRLTQEYVDEFIANEDWTNTSIYENARKPLNLICPWGHRRQISFDNFANKGNRCVECSGLLPHTQEFVEDFLYIENYTLNLIYKNNRDPINITCPEGHSYCTRFLNYYNLNQRCAECHGNKKFTQEYVNKYITSFGWINNSIYINSDEPLDLTCPENHKCRINFNNFKNKGTRCAQCNFIKYSGENHYNYNPNREELPLNNRLRDPRSKSWIKRHMKDDPNYDNFLLNPDDYTVDHIIPVKLFCKIVAHNNLDEQIVKKAINNRMNLQLLTFDDNRDKWYNGSIFEAYQYLSLYKVNIY